MMVINTYSRKDWIVFLTCNEVSRQIRDSTSYILRLAGLCTYKWLKDYMFWPQHRLSPKVLVIFGHRHASVLFLDGNVVLDVSDMLQNLDRKKVVYLWFLRE